MIKRDIEVFVREFFEGARAFVGIADRTFVLSFGDKAVQVSVNENDGLSTLIEAAFLPSQLVGVDFSLDVWRSSSESVLPNLDWARSFLARDNLVPRTLTHPYRIAFDKSQGFIFLYDTEERHGAIWIAEDEKISLNSFVTPFRIIFSWMAETFGGEIIHASAISRDSKGLIINGPSGSGKSTLALLCALSGFTFIADDAVLYHNGLISALYRYAKVDSRTSPYDLSQFKLFQVERARGSKDILDLMELGDNFITRAEASALVLPIVAHLNHWARISPSLAIRLSAPNSLRELMGGTPYNFRNLVNITREVPSFRIALSNDNHANIEAVTAIFDEVF